MSYTPLHSPFQIPLDHPDHPYQRMQRNHPNPELLSAITRMRPAWGPAAPSADPDSAWEAAAIAEDLDEEAPAGEDCLCQHLTLLAAFTHEVQMQAHLLHLDYEGGGGNFLSVHAFLKSAYERHLEEFDSLLEAVRAMGRKTPATHKELLAILPAFEHAMSTAECRLSNYRENLLQQRKLAQEVEKEAQEAREIGIANMLAEIDAAAAKAAWFIAATLKA
jgi:DNA-binding ferritin-like protein